MGKFFIAQLLATVAMPIATAAQSPDSDTTTLQPIVITATSSERFLQDAPASIGVVSGEDLRSRPVWDLASAIEGTLGVQLTGIGLGRRGISIRGMQPDHSLVLVDGMRVSNSASAIAHSDYELGWVPAEAIERIEIVRGPMSSLYGSEALGGVVNIITRRATDKWQGSITSHGVLTEHGRGGNGYNISGYAGGPLIPDLLGLNLWGTLKGRSELSSPEDSRVSSMGDEKAFSGNATLTWTPDDRQRIDLSYGAGFDERWSGNQGAGRFPTYYRSEDEIWRQRVSLSHEGEWDWGTSRVRVYNSILDRENRRSDSTPASGPHKFIDTVGDGQISFSPLSGQRFTLGGEVRHERLEDPTVNGAGNAEQTHYATFLQDEITFNDQWELVLGSRFDHHEEFGWHASPRAYLLHHFDDALTFKAGIGAGFKAPTLKQLSPDYSAIAGGGRFTIVGNPDLEPETNLSYEAGFEYQQDIWSARAMVFQNDLENLIQTVCVIRCGGAPGATWTYENINKARIRGIELGGGVELPWNMRLDANYTYLDPEDRTTGEQLTGRSRHIANADIAWSPTENLTTSVRVNYVGSQTTTTASGRQPSYTMLSAYADYSFNEHMVLKLGIENITDVRLADENGDYAFADEGRRYFVGLTAKF